VTRTGSPATRVRRHPLALAGRSFVVLALLSLLVCLGAVPPAHGQALDPTSAAALSETLRMLGDPSGRGAATAGNPAARDVDSQVQSLAGSPENAQAVYNLAGEVFADLVKNTGGDTGKLMEALERARTDPSGFANALSPATLQHLRELSSKISDTKR
jgi:hypothetical protein